MTPQNEKFPKSSLTKKTNHTYNMGGERKCLAADNEFQCVQTVIKLFQMLLYVYVSTPPPTTRKSSNSAGSEY